MSSLTRAGFMSCCEVLELDPRGFSSLTDKAALALIQQSYRRLSLQHHPDFFGAKAAKVTQEF